MTIVFGTNDYLQINQENQHQSLYETTDETKPPAGWMRVHRLSLDHIAREYFGYQFFTALGLATPQTRLVNIMLAGDFATSVIDSRIIDEVTDYDTNEEDQTATMNGETLRLNSGFAVTFLGELIVNDSDAGQHLITVENARLCFITKDKENVSNQALPENDDLFWQAHNNLQGYLYYKSTLEQRLFMVHNIENVCLKTNILHQIFHNTRVQATPELDRSLRENLCNAWIKNAERLVKAYKEKYTKEYQAFTVREDIRQRLVEKIVAKIELPSLVNRAQFTKELTEDLRAKFYIEDPSAIREDILTNDAEISRIAKAEQERLWWPRVVEIIKPLIMESMEIDADHLYPQVNSKALLKFYQTQSNQFISKLLPTLNENVVNSIAKSFAEYIKQPHFKKALLDKLGAHYHYLEKPVTEHSISEKMQMMEKYFNDLAQEKASSHEKLNNPKNKKEEIDREISFYSLRKFYKGLVKNIETECDSLGIPQESKKHVVERFSPVKARLKEVSKPAKAVLVEDYAIRVSRNLQSNQFGALEALFPSHPAFFGLERVDDFYNQQQFCFQASEFDIMPDLNIVKSYFEKVFSHYCVDKNDIPDITCDEKRITIRFINSVALQNTFRAIAKDAYKLGHHLTRDCQLSKKSAAVKLKSALCNSQKC